MSGTYNCLILKLRNKFRSKTSLDKVAQSVHIIKKKLLWKITSLTFL